jgi:hypothetical protein
MKICSKCSIEKEITDFYPAPWCKQGVRPECKSCNITTSSKRATKRNKENPNSRRSVVLKNKYNISLEQFNKILISQNYKCKICGTTNPGPRGVFDVDHCHKTGKIRGLLCHLCNAGLGYFRDSILHLESAITYLKDTL